MEWIVKFEMKRNHRFVVTLIVVYLLTFGLGVFVTGFFQDGDIIPPTVPILGAKKVNILVMGIDARKGEVNSRSDTMILASIDKRNKEAVLVWIPRDTRVEVSPGHYNKINSVNALQGPEAACEVVGDLLDINVSYYVVTNFAGFASIVDILGGVHIDVEPNMFHNDPDPKLRINLSPGMQLLDGEDALRYARFRGGPTADIGRTDRQQKLIKALMEEMMQTKTILKLPELVPEILNYVHTNLPMKEMLSLAKLGAGFDKEKLITQTLPGYSYTEPGSGASYWQADPDIAQHIIDSLYAGETFEVIKDRPGWVVQPAAVTEEEVVAEETGETEEMEEPEGEEGTEEVLPNDDTDQQEGEPAENTDQGQPSDQEGDSTGEGQTDTSSGETVAEPDQLEPEGNPYLD